MILDMSEGGDCDLDLDLDHSCWDRHIFQVCTYFISFRIPLDLFSIWYIWQPNGLALLSLLVVVAHCLISFICLYPLQTLLSMLDCFTP